MDESHENMLKNYENTSDEIEKLRKLFKGYGALGCKMIGEGWYLFFYNKGVDVLLH
jgi:galactokinase